MRTAFVFAALVGAALAIKQDVTSDVEIFDEPVVVEEPVDWGTKDDDFEALGEMDYQYDYVEGDVTQATDFYDNAEEKEDFVELDTEGIPLYNSWYSSMLDTWQNDDFAQAQAASMKAAVTDYYTSQTVLLPEVCEGGAECRAAIKADLEADMSARWSEAMTQMRTHFETLMTNSRTKMHMAYEDAYNCAHGCGCKFIEEQYTVIKNEIDDAQAEIDDLTADIVALTAEIEGINDTICDFGDLIIEYEGIWSSMEEEHIIEMDALADWQTDDWDMDEVVNQEKFREEYGFDYDVDRFDLYTA